MRSIQPDGKRPSVAIIPLLMSVSLGLNLLMCGSCARSIPDPATAVMVRVLVDEKFFSLVEKVTSDGGMDMRDQSIKSTGKMSIPLAGKIEFLLKAGGVLLIERVPPAQK